jgi:hypothetical protein
LFFSSHGFVDEDVDFKISTNAVWLTAGENSIEELSNPVLSGSPNWSTYNVKASQFPGRS